MHRFPAILFGLSLICYLATVFVWNIQYEREIGGHLKLAADANSTELTERKIQLAVEGMRKWGFCNGGGDDCFTSVIYRTPEDDVGYWRENIGNTLEDLKSMSAEERADNLIESNQLIKVRETLLDSGSQGDKVTDPPGISRYPYNVRMAWWLWISLIGAVVGAFMWEHGGRRNW